MANADGAATAATARPSATRPISLVRMRCENDIVCSSLDANPVEPRLRASTGPLDRFWDAADRALEVPTPKSLLHQERDSQRVVFELSLRRSERSDWHCHGTFQGRRAACDHASSMELAQNPVEAAPSRLVGRPSPLACRGTPAVARKALRATCASLWETTAVGSLTSCSRCCRTRVSAPRLA